MPELLHTAITGFPPPKRGKVREVYDLGEDLLIVASDRISAFDVIMANGIPGKGIILNKMSAFWFAKFADICPNHIISTDDAVIEAKIGKSQPELAGRCTLAKKAQPLPIECVARGYIAGSLYKEYRTSGRNILGIELPEGLVDSDMLPEPIFTPATKAVEGHDENICFDRAADMVGTEVANLARDLTLEIFKKAQDHAASVGLILADTKFEFGLTDEGLIWIDEALTPDSSRFWEASEYEPGHAQASYDKQFLRDYLETLAWDKRPPGPTLPENIVYKTREKYLEAYKRLTGETLSLE